MPYTDVFSPLGLIPTGNRAGDPAHALGLQQFQITQCILYTLFSNTVYPRHQPEADTRPPWVPDAISLTRIT